MERPKEDKTDMWWSTISRFDSIVAVYVGFIQISHAATYQ